MRYPEYMTAEDIEQFEYEYALWDDQLEQINLECQVVALEQRLIEAVVVV